MDKCFKQSSTPIYSQLLIPYPFFKPFTQKLLQIAI